MSIKAVKGIILAAVLAGAALLAGCDDKKEAEAADPAVQTGPQTEIPVVISYEDTSQSSAGDMSGNETSDPEIKAGEASGEEETGPDTSGEDADGKEDTDEDASDEDASSDEDEGDDESEEDEEGAGADESASFDEEDDTDDAGPVTPGSVESVGLNSGWTYADYSAINSGSAKLYRAAGNRKGVVIGINAGHGTSGGGSVKTYCHPDMTPKVTGGSTGSGALKAAAVSGGMSFADGTSEASVALREAQILRDRLLSSGYDVLMLRDDSDVQLDNIARTVIANNTAACLISLHWDGDNLSYDKGCFYISTPDGIKGMEPVASNWQKHEALGRSLINGLSSAGCKIYGGGSMSIDLTQTSYSTIPSVDVELGNAASAHDDATLSRLADGLAAGISAMY